VQAGNRDSWTVRIPEGVREVIGRRLNRLSQRCNDSLTIASVIGREFELRQLTPLVEDISEDRLLEVLEEALSARVIEELPQAVGRYQFTHALIQETLTEELTLTRRVRLHARIAETLEELYGVNADAHAAELAHHFALAEMATGTEKLVQYSLLAGERALAAYAWEEAQTHFERGLAARSIPVVGRESLPDAEAAELLFGYARARTGTQERFQSQETVESFVRAFDFYFGTGDSTNAVSVAQYRIPMGNVRTGLTQIVAKALTLVSPGSLEEGWLLSRYGMELGRVEGDYEASQKAFDQALAIAHDMGDATLEMNTLASSADVDYFQLRPDATLSKSLKVIELALHGTETNAEVSARLSATRVLYLTGRCEEAQEQATALLSLGERLGDRYWLGSALQHASNLACLQGDWSSGRSLVERALALAPRDANILVDAVDLEYQTGNFSQGEAYLERLLEVMAHTPPGPRAGYARTAMEIPLLSRATGQLERLDLATEASQVVLTSPTLTPMYEVLARCGLGIQAIINDRTQEAGKQYAALQNIRGILVPFQITGDRVLALLAHTMGKLDQATVHFEESLAFCRKGGFRPELAWTCCDYADTLLQRNEPGDREKATSLLDESLAISSELGMRPLMERVLSRREILKA
ncbi:MAG: hypothetical protein O7E55_06635, partial [Chloroflexi bacterium]|nr:hypothetical protein [Chloroflexota bacterium]